MEALWTIKYIRVHEMDPNEIELRQTPTLYCSSCEMGDAGNELKAMWFMVLIKSF